MNLVDGEHLLLPSKLTTDDVFCSFKNSLMCVVDAFEIDDFDGLCIKESMSAKASLSRDETVIRCDDDRLYESVFTDGKGEVVDVTEVYPDAVVSDDDRVDGDFNCWKGRRGGRRSRGWYRRESRGALRWC